MDKQRHDIGNILGVLIGNAELLLLEDLEPNVKEMVTDMHSAAMRLRTMLLPPSDQTG